MTLLPLFVLFLSSVCLESADVAQINVVTPPSIGLNNVAIESQTPQPQFVPLIRGEPKVSQPNPPPNEPKTRVPRKNETDSGETGKDKDKVVSVVRIEPQAQLAIPKIETKRSLEQEEASLTRVKRQGFRFGY